MGEKDRKGWGGGAGGVHSSMFPSLMGKNILLY